MQALAVYSLCRISDTIRNMPQTQQREVSPSIIRACFDTVLNPLLYGLRTEAGVLSRGDLTWRFRSRAPVSLVPVRSLIMDAVQDNLDQFLSLHPECAGPMQEHDAGLQLLVESCRELESRLIQSKELQVLFQRLTTPEALGGRGVAEIFGAIRPDGWLKVVAEYIINGDTGPLLTSIASTALGSVRSFSPENSARFLFGPGLNDDTAAIAKPVR